MTSLAPTLQAFFTTRLSSQYGASPHTVAAYRDTWRLLLNYAALTTGTKPVDLDLCQINADLINGFLTSLQVERANSIGTRNARLAAAHSSPMPRASTPNTWTRSAASWRSRPDASPGRKSATSPTRRSRRYWQHQIDPPRPDDVTMRCSKSPLPPGCVSPS